MEELTGYDMQRIQYARDNVEAESSTDGEKSEGRKSKGRKSKGIKQRKKKQRNDESKEYGYKAEKTEKRENQMRAKSAWGVGI
jgi:hypothetical protein